MPVRLGSQRLLNESLISELFLAECWCQVHASPFFFLFPCLPLLLCCKHFLVGPLHRLLPLLLDTLGISICRELVPRACLCLMSMTRMQITGRERSTFTTCC
jgi:hypothetical protein